MSCEASQADLCWTRGDTGRLAIEVADDDGTPYDLTGGTLFLTVKNALTDEDSAAVIRKEVTEHGEPTEGKSEIPILPADNATAGTRYYDVQFVDEDGEVFTFSGGVWRVTADVTNRTAPLPDPEEE